MNPIDRFTRDEVSAKVWWPVVLVLIVLTILTLPAEHRAIDAERTAAAGRASVYAEQVIGPAVGGANLKTPLEGDVADRVREVISREVLVDPQVRVVRLWNPDGTLLWSSDDRDPVGSGEALNDLQLHLAVAEPRSPGVTLLSGSDLSGVESPTTFSTYQALGDDSDVSAVAQFEVPDTTLLSDVRRTWLAHRLTVGLAALFILGLALASMREPVAPIGAGVLFYPESLPVGSAVIDEDERIDLERGGTYSRHRVQALESRLRESEKQRVRAEGELQLALSSRASSSPLSESAIPRPGAQRAERPVVTVVPDLDSSTRESPDAVPAANRRRSASSRTTAASPQNDASVAVPDPKPRSKTPKSRRGPAVDLARASGPAPMPTVSRSRDRTAEPERKPELEPRVEPEVPAPQKAEDPGRRPLPDEDVFVLHERPSPEGAGDEDPAHVLQRLVEPVGSHAAPDVDPSVIRTRLARTAALKKPGGRAKEHRLRHVDPQDDPSA